MDLWQGVEWVSRDCAMLEEMDLLTSLSTVVVNRRCSQHEPSIPILFWDASIT